MPVIIVDHKGMDVFNAIAGLGCTPHMRMIRRKITMKMLEYFRIVHRPQQQGGGDTERRQYPERQKCRTHPH